MSADAVLIGNSFPMALVRAPLRITPMPLTELLAAARGAEVLSFWGHENTRAAAEAYCGLDLRPREPRPPLALSPAGRPVLYGREFTVVWVLSPQYRENFRHAVDREIPAEMISGWQCLRLEWE